MARILIAGPGGRERSLARELRDRGHVVDEISPNVAEIVAGLDGVTVVCLFGLERLETVLTKLIDTTVRGVVYEGEHADAVRAACDRSHIPHAIVVAAREEDRAWPSAVADEAENLLKADRNF